jgi:hypothetical protein
LERDFKLFVKPLSASIRRKRAVYYTFVITLSETDLPPRPQLFGHSFLDALSIRSKHSFFECRMPVIELGKNPLPNWGEGMHAYFACR